MQLLSQSLYLTPSRPKVGGANAQPTAQHQRLPHYLTLLGPESFRDSGGQAPNPPIAIGTPEGRGELVCSDVSRRGVAYFPFYVKAQGCHEVF